APLETQQARDEEVGNKAQPIQLRAPPPARPHSVEPTVPKREDAIAFDSSRDRHLFGPGPKRILALDAGGARAVIQLAFLEQLERILGARYVRGNRQFRLGDWFDFIGGTSTGGLLATFIALGYPITDITNIFMNLAPRIFNRSFWRIPG